MALVCMYVRKTPGTTAKLQEGAGSTVSEWPNVSVMVKDETRDRTAADLLSVWTGLFTTDCAAFDVLC